MTMKVESVAVQIAESLKARAVDSRGVGLYTACARPDAPRMGRGISA